MVRTIVIDIETIPEYPEIIESFEDSLGLMKLVSRCKVRKGKTKSDETYRTECENKFSLHWLTARIVCVGIKVVGEDECTMIAEDSEELTLQATYDYITSLDEYITFVSFNGDNFDFPMLRMRGAKHGIPIGRLLPNRRYDKRSFDIYEKMGGKWGISCTLAELAWYCGVEMHGSGADVAEQWENGYLDEIKTHCEYDVRATEHVYDCLRDVL